MMSTTTTASSSFRPTPIAGKLESWYRLNRRDLPWRESCADPQARAYRALVSEAMLQQTQVSRVVAFYERFMGALPMLADLARADEERVLALWQGLGYYRRARNLHKAAQEIMERFDGRIPDDVQSLRSLPGVGAYTAGAIASIAFDRRAAIVDGNVSRVVQRLAAGRFVRRRAGKAGREDERRVWGLAEELVEVCASPGDLNQGLMELGATICLPVAQPECGRCPLRAHCQARKMGIMDKVPRPKPRAAVRDLFAHSVLIEVKSDDKERGGSTRIVLQKRPARGLWSGMWQLPTLETEDGPAGSAAVNRFLRETLNVRMRPTMPVVVIIMRFRHQTTHRRVHFEVSRRKMRVPKIPGGFVAVSLDELAEYALSNAQRRIIEHVYAVKAPHDSQSLIVGVGDGE